MRAADRMKTRLLRIRAILQQVHARGVTHKLRYQISRARNISRRARPVGHLLVSIEGDAHLPIEKSPEHKARGFFIEPNAAAVSR